MTAEETPASSNDDETTQAQTTTEALEWHAPVLVRIDDPPPAQRARAARRDPPAHPTQDRHR